MWCICIYLYLPHIPTLFVPETFTALLTAADHNKNNQCSHKYSSKNTYCNSNNCLHSFHCNAGRRRCLGRCVIPDHKIIQCNATKSNKWHSKVISTKSYVLQIFFIPLCWGRIEHLEASNGDLLQNPTNIPLQCVVCTVSMRHWHLNKMLGWEVLNR